MKHKESIINATIVREVVRQLLTILRIVFFYVSNIPVEWITFSFEFCLLYNKGTWSFQLLWYDLYEDSYHSAVSKTFILFLNVIDNLRFQHRRFHIDVYKMQTPVLSNVRVQTVSTKTWEIAHFFSTFNLIWSVRYRKFWNNKRRKLYIKYSKHHYLFHMQNLFQNDANDI